MQYSADDARAFMKRYRTLTIEIIHLKAEIRHKEELIGSLGMPGDGMPRGNNISKPTERDAIYLADKRAELSALMSEAERERDEIRDVIGKIEDSAVKDIMYKRYIEFKAPGTIARETPCDVRTIRRKHRDGLNEAAEILGRK